MNYFPLWELVIFFWPVIRSVPTGELDPKEKKNKTPFFCYFGLYWLDKIYIFFCSVYFKSAKSNWRFKKSKNKVKVGKGEFKVEKKNKIIVTPFLQGALIRTGQKTFFCKSGWARIGRATLFWCFLGRARIFSIFIHF